ncbi:GcrA family cell cycle regulator [Phenylobacterium sp. J426]|nr:GcrA family cell cycle regulator [Phenylobacterium sp. J426]
MTSRSDAAAGRRGGWPPAAVETLKSLWLAGDLSAADIARRFGVTRNAVLGKVHRLGLSGQRPRGPKAAGSRGSARSAFERRWTGATLHPAERVRDDPLAGAAFGDPARLCACLWRAPRPGRAWPRTGGDPRPAAARRLSLADRRSEGGRLQLLRSSRRRSELLPVPLASGARAAEFVAVPAEESVSRTVLEAAWGEGAAGGACRRG